MSKYRKKPLIIEAELFKRGMEDGYAAHSLSFSSSRGKFLGFYDKEGPIPKVCLYPAIKTLEGWYEVEEGKHYIVTGIKGERYPVEKRIFEESYDLLED